MAESRNIAAELYELGRAISDYGATLTQIVTKAYRIVEDIDAELDRAMKSAADMANGWGLDRESADYQVQRQAMAELYRQLEAASQKYREARYEFLSATSNGAGAHDCFKARSSLERLASALEAYFGVQLLEDSDAGKPPSQKLYKNVYSKCRL